MAKVFLNVKNPMSILVQLVTLIMVKQRLTAAITKVSGRKRFGGSKSV